MAQKLSTMEAAHQQLQQHASEKDVAYQQLHQQDAGKDQEVTILQQLLATSQSEITVLKQQLEDRNSTQVSEDDESMGFELLVNDEAGGIDSDEGEIGSDIQLRDRI